jgi:plasmid stabilization system protein ParE
MPSRRFRVQWAEVAVRDLEELVAFIAVDSPLDAERVLRRVEARAARLESSPARGRVVPELARFGMRTWRELVVRPYRLIYRIESDAVTVLAVFDGRRDLEDLLLERLVRTP